MSAVQVIGKALRELVPSVYEQNYRELKHRRQKLVISRPLPFHTLLVLLRDGISVRVQDDASLPAVSVEAMAA